MFGACYSRVSPSPVKAPRLIAHSQEVAELLGYSPSEIESPDFAEVFAGNSLKEGMSPYSACYGGHQFGSWAGQLGDGRAISLAERRAVDGELYELQLKGAGPTPYSRRADGRAVMRSSVREFLCSEAMHHLGVPTTRALCLVETGDQVVRDMLYDGHPRHEPGAIVCRVAPTFLRFGNFELFASRQDVTTLRALTDFSIRHFFSEVLTCASDRPSTALVTEEEVAAFFSEICRLTAKMVVEWMRVGFVHGVMNTDNMSILGLTIDYGPYGWLEDFDPAWTPNTTDAHGRRYRFGNQQRVCEWNLLQLGNALLPLVSRPEPLEAGLRVFAETLREQEAKMMAQKLGLTALSLGEDGPSSDRVLVAELMDVLSLAETDMTLFYRALSDLPVASAALEMEDLDRLRAPLDGSYYDLGVLTADAKRQIDSWLRKYIRRSLAEETSAETRRSRMNAANPKFVLRNYLAQLAIDEAEKGDGALVMELLDVMRRPYDEQPGREQYAQKRPEWARSRVGCSMLSCSS